MAAQNRSPSPSQSSTSPETTEAALAQITEAEPPPKNLKLSKTRRRRQKRNRNRNLLQEAKVLDQEMTEWQHRERQSHLPANEGPRNQGTGPRTNLPQDQESLAIKRRMRHYVQRILGPLIYKLRPGLTPEEILQEMYITGPRDKNTPPDSTKPDATARQAPMSKTGAGSRGSTPVTSDEDARMSDSNMSTTSTKTHSPLDGNTSEDWDKETTGREYLGIRLMGRTALYMEQRFSVLENQLPQSRALIYSRYKGTDLKRFVRPPRLEYPTSKTWRNSTFGAFQKRFEAIISGYNLLMARTTMDLWLAILTGNKLHEHRISWKISSNQNRRQNTPEEWLCQILTELLEEFWESLRKYPAILQDHSDESLGEKTKPQDNKEEEKPDQLTLGRFINTPTEVPSAPQPESPMIGSANLPSNGSGDRSRTPSESASTRSSSSSIKSESGRTSPDSAKKEGGSPLPNKILHWQMSDDRPSPPPSPMGEQSQAEEV
jgi:hypothetical protein